MYLPFFALNFVVSYTVCTQKAIQKRAGAGLGSAHCPPSLLFRLSVAAQQDPRAPPAQLSTSPGQTTHAAIAATHQESIIFFGDRKKKKNQQRGSIMYHSQTPEDSAGLCAVLQKQML